MKVRIAITSLVCAVSALAFASLMTTWSTNGSGTVRNAAGRQGAFRVEAAKRVHNNTTPQIHGIFVLEFPSTVNTGGERLALEVREYVQDGNTSRVAGPAVWRVQTPTGPHEFHGLAHARFTSNRHPDEPSLAPDTLEVHFEMEKGNITFDFGGAVVRGDITVAKTESY